MLLTKAILPLAVLARTALADGAAIVSALTTISNITLTLNSTLSSWDGGLLGTIPVVVQSTELLAAINNGTSVAQASANLTTLESVKVAVQVLKLVSTVNSTMTTIMAAKPKFDHLLLSPVILLNLELEKGATDKMSAALIEKVPTALQATASSLSAKIDDSFNEAIALYNPFSGL